MSLHRCHRRAVTAVAAAVVLPALSLLTPSAASAQQLRFADPRHDVIGLDLVDVLNGAGPHAEPHRANGDITSAFVHYRTHRLVVRVNFAELHQASNELFQYSGLLRTSKKRLYAFTVNTSPGKYAGHDMLLHARNGRRACEMGHRIDFARDFARVVVPLSCLKDPRWVKLQFGAVTYTFDPELFRTGELHRGSLVVHIDEAQSDTTDRTGWTPRVHVPRRML